MTNTIGATPEIARASVFAEQFSSITDKDLFALDAQAAETVAAKTRYMAATLESLISDRAKLREALEKATNLLDSANRGSDRPTNFMYGIVSDNRALLANTTKGQSNATE